MLQGLASGRTSELPASHPPKRPGRHSERATQGGAIPRLKMVPDGSVDFSMANMHVFQTVFWQCFLWPSTTDQSGPTIGFNVFRTEEAVLKPFRDSKITQRYLFTFYKDDDLRGPRCFSNGLETNKTRFETVLEPRQT